MDNDNRPKSIYLFAAEAGSYLGIYLTVISATLLLANKFPALPLVALPLVIGLPFFAAWLMNSIANAEPRYRRLSALWVAGIYSFIFGTLICALFSALYLVFIEPDFLYTYFRNSIETISQAGVSSPLADIDTMRMALDSHMLPTPMQFVISMSWSSCFFGSVLSLPLAAILSRPKNSRKIMSNNL